MGLQQEFVFRCDSCNDQLKGEEYAYPWQHQVETKKVYYLCKVCNFIGSRMVKLGILSEWKWTGKEIAVHAAIYHKEVKAEWISPR